jgi:hypothetical protein
MTAEIALNGVIEAAPKITRKRPLRRAGKLKKPAAAKAGGARKKPLPKAARTSEILRGLLDNNKDKSFTVQKIPVPGISAIVAIPTAIISAQMAMGKKEITLPKWLLKRSVPRKALAGVIRSILPVLERLESGVRPRWKWMTSSLARKFLGAFILLLAGLMALPVPGTNMPLAIAVFVIALGLVERDGVMITAGLLIGLAAIALLGGIFAGLVALFGRIFA